MVSDEAKILKILSDFKSLIETINSNKNFTDLISNPLINSVKKAKVLKIISEKLNLDRVFSGFILTLAKHNKIILINQVFKQFDKLIDKKNGLTEVLVTTANELEKNKAVQIETEISKKIGTNIKLKKKIDPQIIGGIIIQLGSYMIDNSIKTKLTEDNL